MLMNEIEISSATEIEKNWAAKLMLTSDPWVTLGVTSEQCTKVFQDPNNIVYIAHSHGKSCGVLILQDHGVAGSPYIKSLIIDSAYRNLGIGKQFLKFAEEKYKHAFKHLFLCVSSFNDQAQKFYAANGYERIGEFKDYIKEGYSEILMRKRIS